MENVIEIVGQSFDRDSKHVALEWSFKGIKDMAELDQLRLFPLDNGCIEARNELESLVDLQLHETRY